MKLDSIGVTKMQSHRWQTMAKLPEDTFEAHVAGQAGRSQGQQDPVLTIYGHGIGRGRSGGSFRLLLRFLFYVLFLFLCLLFPTLVLILLTFVTHCVSPFLVVAKLLAARAPLRRQFWLWISSLS
jgi:hypothetical protein